MWKSISLVVASVFLQLLIPSHLTVAQETKKTAYGILLDNTLSLNKQLPQVLLLGKAITTHVHQRGPITLFNFKLKPDAGFFNIHPATDAYEGRNNERATGVLGIDWTQDEEALNNYLETLTATRGHTDLLAAISTIAEAVNAKVNAEKDAFENKIIILITDGEHRTESFGGPDNEDEDRKERESSNS